MISILKQYLKQVKMPLPEVKALVAAGAAREMAKVGVEKYDVVISHASLHTHPNWTSRIFAADGDRLYIGGLHVHPTGISSFLKWQHERNSTYARKTMDESFRPEMRQEFSTPLPPRRPSPSSPPAPNTDSRSAMLPGAQMDKGTPFGAFAVQYPAGICI
ncbi:hypothetical protein HYPSUDRAFT_202602 [Hypholoma sublateritium FD-334 SS-4]|uniref:Uncharacterized protein n=1 Tax=Hypholoma sublateritium (strain FD-334 SS-4) TaxID=945553 RepID=A0A0D2NZJ6_HYPSF|nr:hypothetical protein HYPSUDRAFT_202602 [Hypholoma sublateritium FD-334 SS-4]